MPCPRDEYPVAGRCMPCSQLCFQAAKQGTERLCNELCASYLNDQAQKHPSVPHNSFLWIEILGPVIAILGITALVSFLAYRRWKPQFLRPRRPLPTQDTDPNNRGLLATATGCNRPTQDTEIIEMVPTGQATTDEDPPAYNPTPSGRDTANRQPLLTETPTPGDGPDRHPRGLAIV